MLYTGITEVRAQQEGGIVPSDCAGGSSSDSCTVNHFVELMINVSTWILGIMGSVALALFVYGGFVWVTAAGNASRIDQGKNILTGTVVAIIIILGAFAGINFVADLLGASSDVHEFIDTTPAAVPGSS